ncbi:MAG: MATE family efflux transporter [Longicatena sp.]
MKQTINYQTGKLFPMILKFSIPAAISLLITAIYNIVDRIFIGNFSGTSALAGLSICFPLSYMMMAFGLMCSAGGSTLFSLYAGRNNKEKMNTSFGNAFTLTILFEIALSILLLLLANPILTLFGVTSTSYEYAIIYYRIIALGCVFQGLTLVFCDFVRVSGQPIMGMLITGIGALTNIILDALFVACFHWGVEGAAYATLIGQIFSTIFGAIVVFKGNKQLAIHKTIFRLQKDICYKLLSCGFAFWVAQNAMGFISLVYNCELGKLGGDAAISVYAVIASIMTFVIMPASGISQGIQPIIGNNYGAKNYPRVMSTLYQSTVFSVGITCIIWIIVMLFPKQILMTFGGSQEMYDIGIQAIRLNFCITPILGFVMLTTTFFQSVAKPTPSILITLLRQVVFLIPFIFILPAFLGLQGIFIAQPLSDALALLLSIILVYKEHKLLLSKV